MKVALVALILLLQGCATNAHVSFLCEKLDKHDNKPHYHCNGHMPIFFMVNFK